MSIERMTIENWEKQISKFLIPARMEELHRRLFPILVKFAKGYDNHKIYKLLRKGYNQPALNVWCYENYIIKHFANNKIKKE